MRAVFMRKEPEIDTKEFQVEKVITLPSEQYAYFTQHLMKEHDFIKENVDLMHEKDGVWHCLLVTGEDMDEGVKVRVRLMQDIPLLCRPHRESSDSIRTCWKRRQMACG